MITESEIARNELRMRYENAAVSAAMEVIGSQLYPEGHPICSFNDWKPRDLQQHHLEKVQEYIEDNYRPANTTIVVVGDFDLKDARLILMVLKVQEELLMSPEDAEKFLKLETQNERMSF